ncbi:AAC-rich mRNA clone AAC11 protein [Notolabrus celidotus]|uniref:AAC-rich mRNA clone AAC11 protein n=1 Tax=Notolabrus celidotus TaxID=1203425 RepID=UPI00148FA4AE|nr:AAC-rich mRNA clone AAC11 protein [Notolabrus celidotus]
MATISPSFFILGLVVVLVTAQESSTNGMPATILKGDNATELVTPSSFTSNITTSNTINITTINSTNNNGTINITNNNSTINSTNNNNTVKPTVTKKDGGKMTTPLRPTAKPGDTDEANDKGRDMTTPTPAPDSDRTGIIILIVIIIIALAFGITCFYARKRGRRYSVDLTSRPDEANIPLSTVEPELLIDAVPQNGLQTFESVETITKESEAKPEAREEQKGGADKSVVEPSAESAAPAPSPDSSGDKPKEEPSPPALVEPSGDEKTDDEGAASNKTSVESLKEPNENNSNNADLSQTTDLMMNNNFSDVPLDCPV